MNYSTYRFTLDLRKHQSQTSIAVFKHDTAVKLCISFTDGGNPYHIEDGVTAVLYGKRADGKEIMHSCKIAENKTEIEYKFQSSTSYVKGTVVCQLRLYDADLEIITAPEFAIVVEEGAAGNDDVDIPDEKLSALDDIVQAEILRGEAERERVIAENKRKVAENERATAFSGYSNRILQIEKDQKTMQTTLESIQHNDEWNHVITTLEDLTTEKLAAMSGRVLVKELHYAGTDQFVDGRPYGQLAIEVPKSIELIKFVGSKLFANITGTKDTTISGFVGATYPGDEMLGYFPRLTGFGAVEFCTNPIDVYNCDNVRHCHIRIADHCTNLTDIYSEVNYADGQHTSFYYCKVIDNVRIQGREDDFNRGTVEFQHCSNISNVFNLTEGVPIDYTNCTYVDGDTCDGYYTEAEQGKVQTVTTDGTSAFVSVYSQDEIDGKLGDISSILTALHEGGIE